MAAVEYNTKRDGFYLGESAALNIINEEIILASGAGNLAPGSVIAPISIGAATSAVKASGANTGNGTFVLDATTPVVANAKPGVYTLRCITAVTNGGVFRLEDPDGDVIGDFTIPAGAGNNVTINEQIKGVLTDGTTDFVAGDGFDITIAAGSDKYVLWDPALTNGAGLLDNIAILFSARDATSADKKAVATKNGPATINGNCLTFKSGTSAPNQAIALRGLRRRGMKVLPQHAS